MTILVVEDFAIYRSVLRQVCQVEVGVHLVLEAGSLGEARAILADQAVDLVLLDLDLPDGSGFDLLAELKETRADAVRVIVVSAHAEDYTLVRVERLGAHGFVDKRTGGVSLLRDAVREVLAGRKYLSPFLAERRKALQSDPESFLKRLTEWELKILGLIGRSLSDEEIAGELAISSQTVRMHRSRIMRKLDIAGTPKLIRFALEKASPTTRASARRRTETSTALPRPRVVVVEDEPLFREFLAEVCRRECGARVLGEADAGDKALAVIRAKRPDVVILDLDLPGLDGFSVIATVRAERPATRFLIVTANSHDYTLYRAAQAGVAGMVDKRSDDLGALIRAVAAVLAGGRAFSRRYQEAESRRAQGGDPIYETLTDRERSVLVLIGLGLSDDEIGARLGISPDTAERHRSTLFRKLSIHRTPKLMQLARRRGFTTVPPPPGHVPVFP